jgi:methionine synthase II (cobalamin-independent)
MTKTNKIDTAITIEEIVREYPELIRPLREYGIKCVACGEPIWGTLEENANIKGIQNLEKIIDQLNKRLQGNLSEKNSK